MRISVSGRHFHVPDAVQDYARNKVSKLGQFFDRIRSVDVIVSKESLNYAVEIIVKPDRRKSIIGRDSGIDIQACIDIIVDKLERQVTKHKEKIRNHKHRQGGPAETTAGPVSE